MSHCDTCTCADVKPEECSACGTLPATDPPLLRAYIAAHECGCHWPGNHWSAEDEPERLRRIGVNRELDKAVP